MTTKHTNVIQSHKYIKRKDSSNQQIKIPTHAKNINQVAI